MGTLFVSTDVGNARRAALTALEKCRRAGAWSDAVLGSVMDAEGLDARDRGLAATLCYGVQQNRLLMDYVLQDASGRKLSKVEPKVLDILRISAYQLLFLQKIPASAAVNEAVKLCRALGFARAAGYVNAVLRKIAAAPVIPELRGDPAERLSVRYSHPLWMVRSLLARLDEAETEHYLRLDNLPAPATLQVNTLKTTAEALETALAAEGFAVDRHPFLPDCLTAAGGDVIRTAAFRDGLFYIQDAAAKFAVAVAGPKPAQKILDVCAAPGGKSFAAAILAEGRADITACDIHENKLKRIRAGAERLGLQITTVAADARENRPEWNGRFDLVIADVPCSGLGVIRKKPDIRYKDPSEFAALPEIQCGILRNASRYVKLGGTLLYSTCTIRAEENEAVVRCFLSENSAFAPEDDSTPWGDCSADGMIQLWPQRHGTDGFFVAKMRKSD